TDENIFIDPLSRLYVIEQVAGTAGAPRSLDGPLLAFVPRDVQPATALEPGDILLQVDGERLRGTTEAAARTAGRTTVEATVLRARQQQTLSVVVPAVELLDALRSIENTVVVMQVTQGGASDRAGMKPGDVITRINGEGFAGSLDADRIMR
ncbi:PDZ domain-containing protein, partial [Corallococcus exiguus]|nr:PDZ domain-containing protein [Corallococcus exiguus]